MRESVRGEKSNATRKILSLIDKVRDKVLPPLGIRLEDRAVDQASVWNLEDTKALVIYFGRMKEAEEKKKLEKKK